VYIKLKNSGFQGWIFENVRWTFWGKGVSWHERKPLGRKNSGDDIDVCEQCFVGGSAGKGGGGFNLNGCLVFGFMWDI
jgi:hypothetical protein